MCLEKKGTYDGVFLNFVKKNRNTFSHAFKGWGLAMFMLLRKYRDLFCYLLKLLWNLNQGEGVGHFILLVFTLFRAINCESPMYYYNYAYIVCVIKFG